MSIYCTYGIMTLHREPVARNAEIWFQAVPGHIGNPRYDDAEARAYYDGFLPPRPDSDDDIRAMVIFDDRWGDKDGQRYVCPLLVLSGAEWAAMPLAELWPKLEQPIEELEAYGG